jgi:hypothetical protein
VDAELRRSTAEVNSPRMRSRWRLRSRQVDDVIDHLAAEPFSGTSGETGPVEDLGDLTADVS